jgi:hypothetical protein
LCCWAASGGFSRERANGASSSNLSLLRRKKNSRSKSCVQDLIPPWLTLHTDRRYVQYVRTVLPPELARQQPHARTVRATEHADTGDPTGRSIFLHLASRLLAHARTNCTSPIAKREKSNPPGDKVRTKSSV